LVVLQKKDIPHSLFVFCEFLYEIRGLFCPVSENGKNG